MLLRCRGWRSAPHFPCGGFEGGPSHSCERPKALPRAPTLLAPQKRFTLDVGRPDEAPEGWDNGEVGGFLGAGRLVR